MDHLKDLKLDFGQIIAFLLPGFLGLYGLSISAGNISGPLAAMNEKDVTVGTALMVSLAALALGLLLSAIRWMFLDHVLLWCGIRDTGMDFSKLGDSKKLEAFEAVVNNHYRYYQYYGNSLVSILMAAGVYIGAGGQLSRGWIFGVVGLSIVLLLGAGDCLSAYYRRGRAVLS